MASKWFVFPNPVNNVAARLVASGVTVLAVVAIAAHQPWLSAVIAYGFVARVVSGPRFSPLGRAAIALAPHVAAQPSYVPGPPKRFAQGLGALFSLTATALWLAGSSLGADIVLGILCVPALLEAVFGYCVGCEIVAIGIRAGIVPESICLECADIVKRRVGSGERDRTESPRPATGV